MTGSSVGGTNTTACAACKYQRRKCMPDCPLSPYFPADQPRRFANVHKLFGVSNTLRILKHVDPSKREDTVKSIAYEADMRDKDPVHGCLGVIAMLQNQVLNLKDELAIAHEQLYLLQQQQQSFHSQQSQLQLHALQGTSFATVNSSGVHDSGHVHGSSNAAALMNLQLQPYSSLGGNHLLLSTSSFNDQYLRHESFDPPKLQIAREYDHRYAGEEAADDSSCSLVQRQALALQIKADEHELQRAAPPESSYFGGVARVSSGQFDDSPVSHHQMHHQAALVEEEQAASMQHRTLTAVLIPDGLVNLAVTSDHNVDLRRASNYSSGATAGHVNPDHAEWRSSPGVYLTLTNQH
ncbi:hypothetical protein CY35_02G050400 [Sphagnum magellanicum]|nr:hypothetical protein CY35_02G050400 [Sphagnum magellanicum]